MTTLKSQLLLILAVMCGALLTAKALVDFSRVETRIADEARTQGWVTMLQAGPLIERAYADGHMGDVRRALSQMASIPGTRQVAVVDAGGRVLAASDGTLEGRKASETALAKAMATAADATAEPATAVTNQALHAATPVRLDTRAPDPRLIGPPIQAAGAATLVLEADLSQRFAEARQVALIENGVAAAVVLAVLLLIAWMLDVRLSRPAGRVAGAIEQFDAGERGARAGLKGQNEIARIAKAFDGVADRLQAEENEILDVQVRLERVLKALPFGVMVARREDGRPFYVNPRWRELFGIPMDASRDILSLLSTVRCERPDGSPYPIEHLPIPAVLRTGESAEVRDLRVRRDDAVVALVVHAVPVCLSGSETFDAVLALASEADAAVPMRLEVARRLENVEAPEPAATAAVPAPGGMSAPAASPVPSTQPEPDFRETVLLAESDTETLDLARHTLEMAGYRVLAAGDGDQAMVFFGREGPRVRAVVLDLAMRGPSGEMLLDEILALDPAARVITASGYRPDLPGLAASGKITAFLTRPYGAERLLSTVRGAVESGIGVEPFAGA